MAGASAVRRRGRRRGARALMRYELFIGLRYLRAKRKEAFISLITVISMLGVIIGVMTLNIVLAVMTGFEEDLRDRILGFNPHILVLSFTGAVSDYAEVLDRARSSGSGRGGRRAVRLRAGDALERRRRVTGAVVRGVEPDAENGAIDFAAPPHARAASTDLASCTMCRSTTGARRGRAAGHHSRQGARAPARADARRRGQRHLAGRRCRRRSAWCRASSASSSSGSSIPAWRSTTARWST